MSWQDWFEHFGRTTADPRLLRALEAAGFPPVPPVPRDENDTRVEKGGVMLEFLDVNLCAGRLAGQAGGPGEGHGVLRALTFVANERQRETWPGALPFDLSAEQSQQALRTRLGPPAEVNDTLDWDRWRIDGRDVTVKYRPDRASLRRVTVEAFARTGAPLA